MKSDKIKQDYNHKSIESHWQREWEKSGIYEPDVNTAKKPFYNLMMFPYPSALGLHVGNIYAFVGSDVFGRFKRMQGYDVFEPIGLDGFGIHSENFALKVGEHPLNLSKKTEKNIYGQLHSIGNGYAWSKKVETYVSNYYKWTQWIFVQMFKSGLAYRASAQVNWCPSCKTVLADEQVVVRKSEVRSRKSDKSEIRNPRSEIWVCERCGTGVERRKLTQWFFKIADYAERLLSGLEKIDWSENVKIAQRNWLGKSEGSKIVFSSDIEDNTNVEVFTTRPDTIYGVTYLALAPEHPLVTTIINKAKELLGQEIREFVEDSLRERGQRLQKSLANRAGKRRSQTEENEKVVKSGIFTGFYAVNPLNNKQVPIYIADYVLMDYGTGAIMGVPAHDQRDWDFAKKYKIDIVEVIRPDPRIAKSDVSQASFTGEGTLINSGQFNGLSSLKAIKTITKYIKDSQFGSSESIWHLRDWIISRQRYWGAPIPMIHCDKCEKEGKSWFTTQEAKSWQKVHGSPIRQAQGKQFTVHGSNDWAAGWYPVTEGNLPVELPYVENFKPTGTGISPLASDDKFVNVKCPSCGGRAKRETDVSDTFLDSAWYFLRYPSVKAVNTKLETLNSKQVSKSEIANSKKSLGISDSNLEFPWDREATRRWLPVDMYIGGVEHAVLHLLYSRFLWKVFYDLGYFDFSARGGPASGWEEPFTKFRAHGLLIKDGAKMSKSKGNVVLPDPYIKKFGADTLRTYLMFCGRFDQGGDFRDLGIEGMSRFLKRVWRLVNENLKFPFRLETRSRRAIENLKLNADSAFMMHKTIKKVTEDIESLDYNTAIAALMEWMNALEERTVHSSSIRQAQGKQFTVNSKKEKNVNREPITVNEIKTFLLLLAPFAPHITEELWQRVNGKWKMENGKLKFSIHHRPWPRFDPKLTQAVKVTLVVQVNGKVRDRIEVERGLSEEKAKEIGLASQKTAKFIGSSKPKKVIYVSNRLINFVV